MTDACTGAKKLKPISLEIIKKTKISTLTTEKSQLADCLKKKYTNHCKA